MNKISQTYVSLITILIIFLSISVSCSQNEQASDGTQTKEKTATNLNQNGLGKTKLITGPPEREVFWTITNVKRINAYVTRDGQLIEGDGVLIEGECTTRDQRTPFFDKNKRMFALEDFHGNRFDMQTEMATGVDQRARDVFKIQFSLAGEGKQNLSIESWGSLFITDPEEATKDKPGHKVSLSAFDETTL